MEHVQVDDKALTHPLYRDLIFHGLAYGAERWLLTLQRMCERFAFGMGRTAVSQETGEGSLADNFNSHNRLFLSFSRSLYVYDICMSILTVFWYLFNAICPSGKYT